MAITAAFSAPKGAAMRTRTHDFLARLPVRKFGALLMLFAVVCGGLLVGGSVFS
jgi:hypothetical protein